MPDHYGNGVWFVSLPPMWIDRAGPQARAFYQQRWSYDPFERDAVCLGTGAWMTELLGLGPPVHVDTVSREVVFEAPGNAPADVLAERMRTALEIV